MTNRLIGTFVLKNVLNYIFYHRRLNIKVNQIQGIV